MGCQRPSRFWGLGCPKIYHEAEDTLVSIELSRKGHLNGDQRIVSLICHGLQVTGDAAIGLGVLS
ncbi:hypothetical protein, partial [Thiolapillus sp.]|uniref:hypothetical protein n=1 Tax=Thiolapillus sp. TaxID=2017437 RepID=UPI003AF9D759